MRGKVTGLICKYPLVRDHPRLCGEKCSKTCSEKAYVGSPPPMRGKVSILSPPNYNTRITPAYAGKRSTFGINFNPFTDHPRLCGEKGSSKFWRRTQRGSPPPMRGKAAFRVLGTRPVRITPAYAGKSSEIFECQLPQKDHPRLCGEKW